MAYPTLPVVIPIVPLGENPSPVANAIGNEIMAWENALLHPASQTQAKIRMRQGGNLLEWGPAASGLLSMLGSTGGRSFIGFGAEAGTLPLTFTTRAQPGMVVWTNGSGLFLVSKAALAASADQTPQNLFWSDLTGVPALGVPNVATFTIPVANVAHATPVYPPLTVVSDALGWATGLSAMPGQLKVPAACAGVWAMIAALSWSANASGVRDSRLVVSGSVGQDGFSCLAPAEAIVFAQQVLVLRSINDLDSVALLVQHNAGVTLTVSGEVRLIKVA